MKRFNNRMIQTFGHFLNNMAKELYRNVRLGIFTAIGVLSLVVSLYYIGSRQNLFGSNFRINTYFYNVSGLRSGNTVRFSGIDVGTVESVTILNDTLIEVTLLIDEDIQAFIKKNAVASIGTDGLMGNKLVNISPGGGSAASVADGDRLASVRVMEVDETMRLLNNTNDNINVLSANLRDISEKVNNNQSLWQLLADRAVADNIRNTLVNFRLTGKNTAVLTGDLSSIVKGIQAGNGTIGALITDTLMADRLNQTIIRFQSITDSIAYISGNFLQFSESMKNGEGTMGMLLTDTTFAHTINQTLQQLEDGSRNFNRNMEALQYSWPFKKGFSKKRKH